MYVTPDNEVIAKMLHLPQDKNRLHNKQRAQSVIKDSADYEIDKKSVYDILNYIFKDANLYPYLRQQRPRGTEEGPIKPSM